MVSGLGLSETGRDVGRSGVELALDAATEAIADAGLTADDIDGLAYMSYGDVAADVIADAMGLKLDWVGSANSGAQLGVMISAALAVSSGLCRHVLIYRSVKRLGGLLGSDSGSLPVAAGLWEHHVPYHEYSAANMFAMHARRHMHEYGTTKEQLGWIAITNRFHAGLNDKAVLRTPMTMADYMSAPPISDPFGLFDCDLPIEAGVAMVISAADFATDCPNPAVRFDAVGCANRGRFGWEARLDFPAMAAKDAAAQMWARTDLRPEDVDVAMVYDGFTFLTLSWIEALGFCGTGEGGAFVDGGERIRLGGELPLNTYGGQLSAGRLHGFWLFHEAILQLRGQAGPRQVDGCDVAVTSAGGSFGCGCILLTK
jgi:acetyl-CoA acetyltransferase